MNEKTALSRLSVFMFGAFVFILGAYHSIEVSLFWLTFILSASFSFLSGILLRRNETSFKLKSILFMSSSFLLFPVFNFYVRDYSFNYCFIYPAVIYLMFVAGHSIKFKKNILKSGLVLFFSITFITSSYYYVPVFLFHVNKTETKKQLPEFELIDLKGKIITQENIKDKVVIFFFSGKNSEIDKISKKHSKNKDVLIVKVIEESVFAQSLENVKNNRDLVYNSYTIYFDENNAFLEKLDFDKKIGTFIIDKNMNIRHIHVLNYVNERSYYYKNLEKELNYLLSE